MPVESVAAPSASSNRLLWLGLAGLGALAAARLLRTLTPPDFSYAHRTVLLTGGGRGLGLALARKLAAQGARLALVARSADELEAARQELTATGATVRIYPADLTDAAARTAVVRAVEADFGAVDVLLHNAGIISLSPLENLAPAEFATAMAIHYEAPLHLMRLLVPQMRARGTGRVILIASVGGKVAVPHMAAYSASKFALVGLGEAWATELLATPDVRVTTVCPGLLRTGSAGQVVVKGQHAKEYRWFKLASGLPGLTMNAETAADQILAAGQRGEPEVVLSLPAKILAGLHGLLPGTTIRLLGLVSRALPGPTPDGEANPARKGAELESAATTNALTTLADRAAIRLHETGGGS